jgi:hypothetical protein
MGVWRCVTTGCAIWSLAWVPPAGTDPSPVHLPPRHVGESPAFAVLDMPQAVRGVAPSLAGPAPAFELTALAAPGTADQGLDIVFVGDGFRTSERSQFFATAAATAERLLASEPYVQVRGLFRTHALFVASADSGADHPSRGRSADTAFDTSYDFAGIARLAVANPQKVLAVVAEALPDADLAVVIVNDPEYGGSGGVVPVASVHAEAVHILRHELGHALAGLADEYDMPQPQYPSGDAEPNVASLPHLHPPKWQTWIRPETMVPTPISLAHADHEPVGAYEGARYQAVGMFRPAPACLMRSLDKAMCPVCREAMVTAVSAATATVRGRLPANSVVACVHGHCPQFSLSLAAVPTVAVWWWSNGKHVGSGTTFDPNQLPPGLHHLLARTDDDTAAVRSDPGHVLRETTAWTVVIEPADAARTVPAQAEEAACRARPGAQNGAASVALWLLALAATGWVRAPGRPVQSGRWR